MNKLSFFTPLMHKYEYEFIEKYLNKDDIFLEWGSGNSTLYFSGLVKKVISIEHDKDWINNIQIAVDNYNIENIELNYIAAHTPDPIPCRYEQFKNYIEFPKNNNLKFTKVLIDGRARKYCAKAIYDMIDENVIVMIHDFNREDYQMTLKYYNVIEQLTDGQGIVALKKKSKVIEDNNYY
jgi:hypothetical protein